MQRKTKQHLLLYTPLLLGGALLVISFFVRPETSDGWLRNITASGGAVFLSVFISEMFVKQLPKVMKERKQHAFEQFFGISDSEAAGHFILQADRIDKVLKDLSSNPKQVETLVDEPVPPPEAKAKSNRIFKARRWVNAHDADAARAVREMFRKWNVVPPELYVQGHKEVRPPEKLLEHDDAPCVFSAGLGFTDYTDAVFSEAGDGWMRNFAATEYGDAVGLDWRVYPSSSADFHKPPPNIDGYLVLVPPNWNKDRYLELSDEVLEPEQKKTGLTSQTTEPDDYAIIIRHTHRNRAAVNTPQDEWTESLPRACRTGTARPCPSRSPVSANVSGRS
jgi:hypothetical protein